MSHRHALAPVVLAGILAFGGAASLGPTAWAARPTATPTSTPATSEERLLLSEDFSDGMPSGWHPVEGSWSIVDGRLQGVSTGNQLSRITFGPHLDAYRFEATVSFVQVANASRWAALGLDLAANGSVPWWIATMRSNSVAPNGIEFAERTAGNGWNVTETAAAPTAAGTGKDVKVKVEVRGSRAVWFFDGVRVLETRALVRTTAGVLGFVINGATVTFDDVRVTQIPNTPESLLRGPGEDMDVIAHRGYSRVNPEDTMMAYEAAARAGADFLENDVQSTADGVPMILHDATLDRTTDGTGLLSAAQSGAVAELDAGSWFSPYFSSARVPTSLEMLRHAKSRGRQVLLEIKGPETRPEIERIVAEVGAAAMRESTVIQSFDPEILKTVHAIDPLIRLGLLRAELDADPVAAARAAFASTYNPSWGALAARPQVVAQLHAAGLAVQPWTVDDPRAWRAMDDLGVDGVITNRPGELVGWQSARASAPRPVVAFVSPAPRTTLSRGDVLVAAVDEANAEEVTITLDGEPVVEGAPIDVDSLARGEHDLVATATGPGGSATAATVVTVAATREGMLHLLVDPRLGSETTTLLLQHAVRGEWDKVAKLAATRQLPEDLASLIAADAAALQAG